MQSLCCFCPSDPPPPPPPLPSPICSDLLRVYPGCALSSMTQTFSLVQVLENVQWPGEMPWSAEDFQRYDESSDTLFYSQPRLVTHIDDGAIGALTQCAGQSHRKQRHGVCSIKVVLRRSNPESA